MIETWQQSLPQGISLSCRACGARHRPVLMFLHGFPEAAFIWDELLEYFALPQNGAFRCVAPNLRGFEHSSAPPDAASYRPKYLVQDIAALIACETGGGALAALIAHDWGGAVAWNLANQQPHQLHRLVILNAPHPGTFLRELKNNPAQQAASAYMNFLLRPDSHRLLAENDFQRLWPFFHDDGATLGSAHWLSDARKARYRALWTLGLNGPCNYYRASPLRPAPTNHPAALTLEIARENLTVRVPTLVLWGLRDKALLPALLDGLEDYIDPLRIQTLSQASHWCLHQQPDQVKAALEEFLHTT